MNINKTNNETNDNDIAVIDKPIDVITDAKSVDDKPVKTPKLTQSQKNAIQYHLDIFDNVENVKLISKYYRLTNTDVEQHHSFKLVFIAPDTKSSWKYLIYNKKVGYILSRPNFMNKTNIDTAKLNSMSASEKSEYLSPKLNDKFEITFDVKNHPHHIHWDSAGNALCNDLLLKINGNLEIVNACNNFITAK